MKKLTDLTLQELGQFSAACILATTLTACGGTSTGTGNGEDGGGDNQGLIGGDNTDSDDDGLPDVTEDALGTSNINPDTDGDGLSDGDEWNTYFTDPTNNDSDNDGTSDGDEIALGRDPSDPVDGTPDSGNGDNNTTADRCDDPNSSNAEWQDNCVLKRYGTYAESAYTQGVQRITWCQGHDRGVTDINVFADGKFGPNTAESIREYQAANNLLVDGIVGPETWGSLFSKLSVIPGVSTEAEQYSIDGCNADIVQFYKEFDGLLEKGWKMAKTPGSAELVEFGNNSPY